MKRLTEQQVKELIRLFNENDENELWSNFYLRVYDNDNKEIDFDRVEIVKRNSIFFE